MADTAKLQNFGEQAAAGLSETLNALLGREVHVAFSQVADTTSDSVASALETSYLCSTLKGSGGLEGMALLLVKEKDASIISDLLIGQDGTSAPDKMTELHLSAFGEVVHQVVEVFTKEARKSVGSKALWEVNQTGPQDPLGAGQQLSELESSITIFSFGVFVQDILSGDLLLCLSESVASKLATGSEKPAAMATVGNVQSGVSTVNTQMRAGGAVMSQLENEFQGSSRATGGNIGLLLDVPLKLTVELGRTTKLVKEILALAPGSVVELDKLAGEAVDILVNEKLIAKGEVVVIDENFGVRITEIINPEERLTAVQG